MNVLLKVWIVLEFHLLWSTIGYFRSTGWGYKYVFSLQQRNTRKHFKVLVLIEALFMNGNKHTLGFLCIVSLGPRPKTNPSTDRFQYPPHAILKAIRAGVGFGSGTETKIKGNWLELITAEGKGWWSTKYVGLVVILPTDMCSGESLCHALLDFLRTSIQFYPTKIIDSVQETGIICSCLESYFMLDIVCYEAKIEESDQLTVALKGTWNWVIYTTCAVHEKDGESWGSSSCHGSYFSPPPPPSKVEQDGAL